MYLYQIYLLTYMIITIKIICEWKYRQEYQHNMYVLRLHVTCCIKILVVTCGYDDLMYEKYIVCEIINKFLLPNKKYS